MEAVLVSNGPGELYTWVRPVVRVLRERHPDVGVAVSLIPCQFAAGSEARIARGFDVDGVSTPSETTRFLTLGQRPGALRGTGGFVLNLGGSVAMAVRLAKRLGYPAYRYSFEPYGHPGLRRLFVHDERTARKARLLGTHGGRLEAIGNLVADAVDAAPPAGAKGDPHVLVFASSRDSFAVHLIPFMIGVVDELAAGLPGARFVWPVSRLLKDSTIDDGIRGVHARDFGGRAGRRDGSVIITPRGARLEMVPEEDRYGHMRAADLAVTIPGTNTLELGIAGVPSVVLLPLNRPEVIPLEGPGHWLSLVPFVGTALKRNAVRLFVERLDAPVSLPNRMSGRDLMVEVKGRIDPVGVAERALSLLRDDVDRTRRRTLLLELMPRPGAARRLVERVLEDAAT